MPKHHAPRAPSTRKRMIWMLLLAGLVFGGIFGVKAFLAAGTNKFFDNMPQPPVAISAVAAREQDWADELEAVGTLVAINGTDVTTESGGVVRQIAFEPGQPVKKGAMLVQLNSSNELATLKSLEAAAKLAVVQRDRWRELGMQKLVSRAEVDQRSSDAAVALANADAQRALIAQKTIRAPFDGVLGIRKINLGQFVSPGDPIVSLQSLDPIFVNFSLPEQRMTQVKEGGSVHATIDALPGQDFTGTITAIEPGVDANTRNFSVQATLRNPDGVLRPGTFAHIGFDAGAAKKVVVIPQSAVSFNPYGNAVYVISQVPADKQAPADKNAKADTGDKQGQAAGPTLTVKQRFIKTGTTRGDLVTVIDGLKPGERVATSGLLKLRNDAVVTINNKIQPTADARPEPENR